MNLEIHHLMHDPIIGITSDLSDGKFTVSRQYVDAVRDAGGLPMVLPCVPALAEQFLSQCDGILFTGGDDPIMEKWGEPTHTAATKVHPDRQAFELKLFELLEARPEKPVLAVCLGMQFMGLHAGGALAQHLPGSHPESAKQHALGARHLITGDLGAGVVHSRHHQALTDAGRLDVVARSEDGMIEAIRDTSRPLYLGVQWHPERTEDAALGQALIQQLVDAARARTISPV